MRWMFCALALSMTCGCRAYTLDGEERLAHRPMPSMETSRPAKGLPDLPEPRILASLGRPTVDRSTEPATLLPVVAVKEKEQPDKDKKYPSILDRLEVKDSLLGMKVPDIQMWRRDATEKEKDELIKKQFPDLPKLVPLPEAQPGPDGRPLSLDDLEKIAMRSNPLIRQAALDIEAARGAALQAGLYPNPTVSYDGGNIGIAQNPQGNSITGPRSAGAQGGALDQLIKTFGKIPLARRAAQYEVTMAEKRLKQAESDVQALVRAQYFSVLSARKNFQTNYSLTKLTDELALVLQLQFRAGEVAAYEPVQTRVLAMQARTQLVQAQNRYVSAWKQLAAALGTPTLPLTELAGQVDMPVPVFEQDAVLRYVLANHTDMLNAAIGVSKAQTLVRLAEIQPYPDVAIRYGMQRDMTTPPFFLMHNVQVGVALPIYDRNQGNIHQARALLDKAMREDGRVRNDLSARIAEAFERYENNRAILKMYRESMLPNQVQAFRATAARLAVGGDKNLSYNDVVTSQQTLANLINSYLGALSDQWVAVVDIAHLMQTSDLFNANAMEEVAPVPDVHEILRPNSHQRR